jgi:hypothetical protein
VLALEQRLWTGNKRTRAHEMHSLRQAILLQSAEASSVECITHVSRHRRTIEEAATKGNTLQSGSFGRGTRGIGAYSKGTSNDYPVISTIPAALPGRLTTITTVLQTKEEAQNLAQW